MHTHTPRLSVLARVLLTLGCTATGLVSTAQAEVQGLDLPVPVAQEPIGRSTGMAPNVLIIVDDSHSMDYSYMPESLTRDNRLKKPTAFHGGTMFATTKQNVNGHFFGGRMWYDSNTDFPVNLIRFDPNKDYLPWPTGEPRPSPNADFPRVQDSARDLLDAPVGLPDSPGETRRTRLWLYDEVVYYKNTKDKKYFGEKYRSDPEGSDGYNGYTVRWWVKRHRSMTDLRDTSDFYNPGTGLHTSGALPPLYIMRVNEQYIKGKYGGTDDPSDETQYFKITFALDKQYGLWRTEISGVKYDPNNPNDPLNDVDEESWLTRDFGKKKAWPDKQNFVFLDKDGKVTRSISPRDLFKNYWNFLFYHNSRQALARGALLETIAERGEDLRAGYTTLHPTMSKKNNKLGDCSVNPPPDKTPCKITPSTTPLPILHRIPVNTDDGLLTRANRSTLSQQIMNSRVNSGVQVITALRTALHTAGQYFSDTTSSDSPYKGKKTLSCRQNLALLLTDGAYFKEQPSDWGDVDGKSGETIVSANGLRHYKYEPAAPFRDGAGKAYSNTLADVAMYYWNRDLVPDNNTEAGKNDVPITGNDPAFWQHMRTYAISFGEGQVLSSNIPPGMPGAERAFWTNHNNGTIQGVMEDLWHATVNGRGQYFTANDSAQLAHALKTILGEANSGSGPGSTAAASAYLFDDADSDDILQFSASYSASSLSSTLQACKLGTVCSDDNAAWDVSKRLAISGTGKDGVPGSARNIFVNNGAQMLPFEWDNLAASQKWALANGKEALGKETVRYLRGDTTLDNQTIADPDTVDPSEQKWRTRAELDGGSRNVLGMIVHGTPTFIGAPEEIRTELSSTLTDYKAFQEANKDRPAILYVAANDGMVHAIITERRALTVIADGKGTTRTYEPGDELFAFIPAAAVNKNMRDFTRPPFEINQHYLLDGELNYSEVKLGDKWKTVLVGSMGAAGGADSADPAVFALDVTDPTQPKLLWEVTSAEMGQTMGRPVIAPVGEGKWSVFIGSGPNQTKTQSRSAILQIDLETGDITTLQDANMRANHGGILGLHVVDTDHDNYADTVYAGDLAGNLWKVSNLHADATGGPQYAKLFHAPRPISAPPTSTVDKAGVRWLFFGTGRALTDADLVDTKSIDTWYGIQDVNGEVRENELLTRNYSVVQAARTAGAPTEDAVIMNYAVNGDMDGKKGWQIPLNQSADAATPAYMVLQNRIRNGLLVGQMNFSMNPEPSCEGMNIQSRLMVLDPFTGAVSPDSASLGNIDVNDDGDVNAQDLFGGTTGGNQPGGSATGAVPIVGLGFGRGELSGSILIVQQQHMKIGSSGGSGNTSASAKKGDEYTRTCALDANGKRVCLPPDPEGKPPSAHTWTELRYDDVQ